MTRDTGVRITALLPGSPHLTFKLIGYDKLGGGVGGWKEVARKMRDPLLVWTEQPLRTYTLPLRFDRFESLYEDTVEGDCRALEDWASAGRRRVGALNPPTLVRVSGNVRVPLSMNWAITGLDWGEFITGSSGDRIQQDVTVSLTQRVSASDKGYADALRQALE